MGYLAKGTCVASTTTFGRLIPEYDFPVINEREVRAAAGILFLIGFTGLLTAITTGNFDLARAFALYFVLDMAIRLFVKTAWSPSLLLGRLAVYRQRPEWVEAKPKRFAWSLGIVLALITCVSFGRLNAPAELVLSLCGVCLAFLFAEAAFGICVGCEIQQRFSKTKPQLCPGDSCNYVPPTK